MSILNDFPLCKPSFNPEADKSAQAAEPCRYSHVTTTLCGVDEAVELPQDEVSAFENITLGEILRTTMATPNMLVQNNYVAPQLTLKHKSLHMAPRD